MMTMKSFRILVLTSIVLGSSIRCCQGAPRLLKKQTLVVPEDEVEEQPQKQKREQKQQLATKSTPSATSTFPLQPTGSGSPPFWHRWLQTNPTDVVLAGLVNLFIPAFVDEIENSVVQSLDPINIGYRDEQELGDVDLTLEQVFCNDTSATAMLVYELVNMTGMGTMDIQRIELVQGSQDINIPFGAVFGAQESTWSGNWIVEAEFTRFNAFTIATLQTTFCDFTFEEVLTSISTARRPQVYLEVKLQGKTDNIYQFNDQSTLQKADIQEMKVGFESFNTRLGIFNDQTTMDADAVATEIVESGLADGTFESLIQEAVQNGINSNLPFRLGN